MGNGAVYYGEGSQYYGEISAIKIKVLTVAQKKGFGLDSVWLLGPYIRVSLPGNT
jgi:hypothetical protein